MIHNWIKALVLSLRFGGKDNMVPGHGNDIHYSMILNIWPSLLHNGLGHWPFGQGPIKFYAFSLSSFLPLFYLFFVFKKLFYTFSPLYVFEFGAYKKIPQKSCDIFEGSGIWWHCHDTSSWELKTLFQNIYLFSVH